MAPFVTFEAFAIVFVLAVVALVIIITGRYASTARVGHALRAQYLAGLFQTIPRETAEFLGTFCSMSFPAPALPRLRIDHRADHRALASL
jgi:hypothetical protein